VWNLRRKSDVAEKAIAPAVKFFREIRPKDGVVVLNDDDCDGICSGTILNIVLRKFCRSRPVQIPTEWGMKLSGRIVKKILARKPKYVIISDVPDMDLELLGRLSGAAKVLIVDHHALKKYKNVVYSNPRLFDAKAYLPATYLAYKISEKLGIGERKIIWVAAVGVLGDHGVENCKDLFVRLKKEFPDLVGDYEIGSESLFEGSKLGMLTKIVDSGRVVKADAGSRHAAKVLLESADYNAILSGKTAAVKKLLAWHKFVEKEFDRLVGEFKEKSVQVGNVMFFEFESDLKLKSSLAGAIEKFYDDKIIVVAQKEGKYYALSMRRGRNNNTDLDRLMRSAIKNIPGSTGGGHPQASGGRIPAKYKAVFLKNLA